MLFLFSGLLSSSTCHTIQTMIAAVALIAVLVALLGVMSTVIIGLHYYLGTRLITDANGKPVWTCVHGTQGAAQFMKKPAVPALNPNRAPAPGTVWEEK